jgi:hypothetical protein
MTEAARELASSCYGYGCWNARYWFIGPEQGLSRHENGAELEVRLNAFRKTAIDGLSDSKAFHELVPGSDWHTTERPTLQPTWRYLILLLAAFKGAGEDADSRRLYQAKHWGRSDGETCLIELSGIPARSLRTEVDRESFRPARMRFIHEKMERWKPAFVVIYGKSQWQHWRAFWKTNDVPFQEDDGLVKLGFTTIVFANQPTAFGSRNEYWQNLGRKLRAILPQPAIR